MRLPILIADPSAHHSHLDYYNSPSSNFQVKLACTQHVVSDHCSGGKTTSHVYERYTFRNTKLGDRSQTMVLFEVDPMNRKNMVVVYLPAECIFLRKWRRTKQEEMNSCFLLVKTIKAVGKGIATGSSLLRY